MRVFLFVLASILGVTGCFGSHGDDADGGAGGGSHSDAGVASDASGGRSSGSSGGGGSASGSGGSSGSGSGSSGSTDASVAPVEDAGLDLIDACIDACDHLLACYPEFDRVECVADCLDSRDWLGSEPCEALTRDLFTCIRSLDCPELSDRDITDTACGPIVDALEASCDAPPAAGEAPPGDG